MLCAGTHDRKDCKRANIEEFRCSNCNGNHPANSKECKFIQIGKKIEKNRVTKGITYPEAKNLTLSQIRANNDNDKDGRHIIHPPSKQPSYRDILQNKPEILTKTIHCQTEEYLNREELTTIIKNIITEIFAKDIVGATPETREKIIESAIETAKNKSTDFTVSKRQSVSFSSTATHDEVTTTETSDIEEEEKKKKKKKRSKKSKKDKTSSKSKKKSQ